MREKQRQGQQAVHNGKAFEDDLARKLTDQLGYRQFPRVPQALSLPLVETPPAFFVRECRGLAINVYEGSMRLDFYLCHPTKHPRGLIIELKYQERGGSLDEKLYFTVNSLLGTPIPSLLLLVGNGFKRPAVRWCVRQHHPGRLWVITDWAELLRLINQGFF
jgi:PD-(D/E)XK nuclease superfamily protein